MLGRGGKDLICGGRKGDILNGGPGRDKLYGGTHRDMCNGERREHRHHYGCNVHGDPFGRVVVKPPNVPGKMKISDALPAPHLAPPGLGSGTPKAGGYFTADGPVCLPDVSFPTIRLGKIYFQTYYTNPGYIAVLPV